MYKNIFLLLVLISAQNLFSQNEGEQQQEKVIPKEEKVQSAPTSVKLNTPTLNMDVLLDLYSKDIDFNVDYTGKSFTKPQGVEKGTIPNKKLPEKYLEEQTDESEPQKYFIDEKGNVKYIYEDRPRRNSLEQIEYPKSVRDEDLAGEITDIIDTSKVKRRGDRLGSYSKEDADYNKSLYNLQIAQNFIARKKYNEALIEIEKSIAYAPNLALAHALKGSIFYLLKRKDEAITSWLRALELDPAMDNVRAILYRINTGK